MSGFDEEFTPAESLRLKEIMIPFGTDRKISLITLIKGWVKHVERLESEHSSKHASDPETWTAWDYIATLLLRDHIEEAIASVSDPLGSKIRVWIKMVDAELCSFTQTDDSGIFARFASEAATEDLFSKGWWWSRVPVSGPVREELKEWAQNMRIQ